MAGRNGLPITLDTLNLGCSYQLHSSHRFVSTWGVVMLNKRKKKESEKSFQSYGRSECETLIDGVSQTISWQQ